MTSANIQSSEDTIRAEIIEWMAATIETPAPSDGTLPPLWHWLLFQEWVPASCLGEDGHAARGDFLPFDPELPRRMWAGGVVHIHAPLRAGERIKRTSTVLRTQEKHGSSGRMLLVTVGHEIRNPAGLALTEEQNLLFLGRKHAPRSEGQADAAAPDHAVTRVVTPDSALLFRYSALTGNAHRIHYDQSYATHDGYEGVLVHAPLQATWLADLIGRARFGAISRFEYRAQRPAFGGMPLTLECWQERDLVRLRTRASDGAVCMSAEAKLR